jgi:PcfJ-like protein
MKLLDVFRMIDESQFLIERDVINAKELKAWAKESAARLTDPQAATWYASQLSKYLINRYEEGLRTAQFDAQAPDWVMAKLDAGEQIFTVEPMPELRQQAEQVIDWLNAANAADNSSPNLRMSWEDAVEAQAEWHKDIARQSRVTELTAEQMEGIVTIMEFSDGYRWVDVQTEVCLQHEGTVMGHCVGQGGYTTGVKEGTTKILSLRDGNNNPHATIEGVSEYPIVINADMLNSGQADLFLDNALEKSFVDLAIRQIKGKENKAVVRKYRDYVQEFLTKFQIKTLEYGGLNDLENCGLFILHKGGYVNVEEVGEQMTTMEDGTVWQRVNGREVELSSYAGSLDAKWYLYDKNGRSIGNMTEENAGVINRINIADGYNQPTAEKEKYKNHVNAAFATGEVRPDGALYSGFYNALEGFGLGVNHQRVNEPQTVGKLHVKTEAGEVYATQWGGEGNMFWLMNGDKIKARFTISKQVAAQAGYQMIFDSNRGLPSGNVTSFIKKVEESFPGEVNINYVQIQDNNLAVHQLEYAGDASEEFIMEEDGVKFYSHGFDEGNKWYDGVDSHNNLLFNMSFDKTKFKTILGNKKISGYYAIYLIEHLEADIGEFTDYSSFARELLDETDWFEGRNSATWYVMDENFPIHFTETHTYDDDTEEDVYDDDSTMKHYWEETDLRGSGMDEDYFASEYEIVYRGANTGYDDEHEPYDDEAIGGRLHVRTDYYIQGIGNADTVTHPVSGGSVRIQK